MIIIPARIGSSRFRGKVLVDVAGVPMVIRTAQAVADVDEVLIATDVQEVIEVADKWGIKAVMTNEAHQSGTDRVFEAAQKASLDETDVVINVQADEPFIEAEVVEAVHRLTLKHADNPSVMMCSCYKVIESSFADDPNIVKTVTDDHGMALYFSRAKIPFPRDRHFNRYKGHIGIYGYTVGDLKRFCALEGTALEKIEKLEQLRALSHGYKIALQEVETESFGIDTPEDLERALKMHTL